MLLIDTDPQGSLTIALGHSRPDDLPVTLTDLMAKVMQDQPLSSKEGILQHEEGVELVPANITLSGLEVSLVNAMSRETVLKQYLETVKGSYDFILLDCMPSLGMLTVNALAASDQVLIPVQANYLSAKGLEQLLQTVNKVKRQINPKLRIEGILLTMVDYRTNFAKEISTLIRDTYGERLKVYDDSRRKSAIRTYFTVIYCFKASIARAQARYPLFHSDRGFQYTGKPFCTRLKKHHMKQSMSRVPIVPTMGRWKVVGVF